jgi:serine protease Do
VSLITMTPEARVQFNGYKGTGVGVAQVSPGSPAMSSGLEPGDVIERINGKDITKAEDATAIIKALKPGSDISMSVWSAGAKKLVSTKVAERPAVIGAPDPQQQQQQGDPSGGDQQPGQ